MCSEEPPRRLSRTIRLEFVIRVGLPPVPLASSKQNSFSQSCCQHPSTLARCRRSIVNGGGCILSGSIKSTKLSLLHYFRLLPRLINSMPHYFRPRSWCVNSIPVPPLPKPEGGAYLRYLHCEFLVILFESDDSQLRDRRCFTNASSLSRPVSKSTKPKSDISALPYGAFARGWTVERLLPNITGVNTCSQSLEFNSRLSQCEPSDEIP